MADGSFASRLESGKEWEHEVVELLEQNPRVVSVALNGTEHTHPEFVDRLRKNDSQESKLLRYAPDGVYLGATGFVYHWEAKHSTAIEKDAWMVYAAYQMIGCSIVVFVKHPDTGKRYYAELQNMKLIPGEETVKRFPPENRFPVEDGWIMRPGRTPYREIDFESLTEL